MQFLKLGKYTINPAAITYIDWDYQHQDFVRDKPIHKVKIYFNIPADDSIFTIAIDADSLEAKALAQHFANPNFGLDLLLLYGDEDKNSSWLESRATLEQAEL